MIFLVHHVNRIIPIILYLHHRVMKTKLRLWAVARQKETLIRIVYGNNLLTLLNKFPINCKHELNVISDKDGALKMVNASEIVSFCRTLENESVTKRMIMEIGLENADYCKQL